MRRPLTRTADDEPGRRLRTLSARLRVGGAELRNALANNDVVDASVPEIAGELKRSKLRIDARAREIYPRTFQARGRESSVETY